MSRMRKKQREKFRFLLASNKERPACTSLGLVPLGVLAISTLQSAGPMAYPWPLEIINKFRCILVFRMLEI